MMSIAEQIVAVCIASVIVCIPATALRFLAARRSGRKLAAEDWCALGALIVLLVYLIIGFMIQRVTEGKTPDEIGPERVTASLKLQYGMQPLFVFNQLFAKFSFLFFYHRLFGVDKIYRRWIFALGAFHIAWGIATLPLYLFSCSPIHKFWVPQTDGWCINNAAAIAGAETVNSTIDFAFVIFPFFPIKDLSLDRRTKMKLGLLFLLGGFAGAIGFIKIGISYQTKDLAQSNIYIGLWAIVQMGCSVLCCCAPTYKPLFPKQGLGFHLLTSLKNLGSWGSSPTFGSVWSRRTKSAGHTGEGSTTERATEVPSWVSRDQGSDRALTWAEIEGGNDQESVHGAGYQMRRIDIQQKIDRV